MFHSNYVLLILIYLLLINILPFQFSITLIIYCPWPNWISELLLDNFDIWVLKNGTPFFFEFLEKNTCFKQLAYTLFFVYSKILFIIIVTHDRDVGAQSGSDKQKNGTRRTNNLSGPLSLPTRASANSLSAPIRSSAGRI